MLFALAAYLARVVHVTVERRVRVPAPRINAVVVMDALAEEKEAFVVAIHARAVDPARSPQERWHQLQERKQKDVPRINAVVVMDALAEEKEAFVVAIHARAVDPVLPTRSPQERWHQLQERKQKDVPRIRHVHVGLHALAGIVLVGQRVQRK